MYPHPFDFWNIGQHPGTKYTCIVHSSSLHIVEVGIEVFIIISGLFYLTLHPYI